MRLAFTIAVFLFAFRALGAEESAPPPPPAVAPSALPPLATPTWSLGAGLSFFASGVSGGIAATTPNGLAPLTSPVTPSVSVERLFSPRFALGLGLEGTVQNVSTNRGATNVLIGAIGFGISPRFIMTSTNAPVSFTFFSTLLAGYSTGGQAVEGNPNVFGNALSLGVGGGIALELRLLERLALRVQANLARLSISTLASVSGGGNGFNQVVVGASFIPSPSIELRLYL